MTISTLIIKINNYVYLHCWPISVVPTCPPSSSWLGIVIGTLVTLIMAITVIVLVMTDLKCCRHSIASKHWNIYHFLLPWIYLAYISRKQAVYNPMISGFSASIVQLYSVSIRPDKLDLLFLISHFLNLGAGGRLLFITSLFKWP